MCGVCLAVAGRAPVSKAGSSRGQGDVDSAPSRPVSCEACAARCALDPGARGGAASAAESRVPPEEVLADAGGAALWRAFLRRSQANWSTDDSFQNSFCKACLPRAWAFQVLSVLFLCT